MLGIPWKAVKALESIELLVHKWSSMLDLVGRNSMWAV